MSPQTWQDISYVLIVVGIVFLIVTIVLSVKFQLVSMIRVMLSDRKDAAAGNEYFDYVGNKNNDIDRIEGSVRTQTGEKVNTVLAEHSEPVRTQIQKKSAPVKNSSTVLVSPERKAPADSSGTVLISRKNRHHENSEDEFVITENIIVIHGNAEMIV
jgi:Na+(H+)/acetate symporter ActP